MDNVVHIHRDAHHETRLLLPWFVNGTLTAVEHEAVGAHLAKCAECRTDLAAERRLIAGIDALRIDTPLGRNVGEGGGATPARGRALRRIAPWLGWAIAAQILLLIGARALWPATPPIYHTLASASDGSTANLAVIFRPRTTEAEIRTLLIASHARLVGGPTPADAWLLSVPPTERAAALRVLRQRSEVMTVAPVDPVGP